MIQHDATTWFEDKFLDFFEKDFKGNTMGTMKFPKSTLKNFDENDITSINKLANNLANIWISAIARNKDILNQTEFIYFEKDTQESLKQAVAEAVQHAIYNRDIWERVNASTVSYSGTFAMDTTGWLLSTDMFGKNAWNLIQNSGIDDYAWYDDKYVLYEQLQNGNLKLLKVEDII